MKVIGKALFLLWVRLLLAVFQGAAITYFALVFFRLNDNKIVADIISKYDFDFFGCFALLIIAKEQSLLLWKWLRKKSGSSIGVNQSQ